MRNWLAAMAMLVLGALSGAILAVEADEQAANDQHRRIRLALVEQFAHVLH